MVKNLRIRSVKGTKEVHGQVETGWEMVDWIPGTS